MFGGYLIVLENDESRQRFWRQFHGPNKGYIEEQYDLFKEDADAVEPSIRQIFDRYGAPDWLNQTEETAVNQSGPNINIPKLTAAIEFVGAIRRYGYLDADIYAVGSHMGNKSNVLNLEAYGLTEDELREMNASWLWKNAPADVENGLDVVNRLKKYYTGTLAFEFNHLNNDEEQQWLSELIESGGARFEFSDDEKKQLLDRLAQVQGFETFLGKTFIGQKRFSIEGLETMIPIMDRIVNNAVSENMSDIVMGMAHRGRLAVLGHVLEKPLDKIFSEFNHSSGKELIPSEESEISYGWTGDVKYHYGAKKDTSGSKPTKITLAHNPSHLEFVNPIVEGATRAAQDDDSRRGYPEQDASKAMSLLIHGDAAFVGEGVVAETLNLSKLPGYNTGGTIHVIANNLLGYTTERIDGRSTRYSSDLAKAFEIPIMRVNADDPISCVSAAEIAYQFRKKFKKDILIDLVGYRRYGHNEMDEPRTTQPKLYQEIDNHLSVRDVFAESLQSKNIITSDEFDQMKNRVETDLRDIYNGMSEREIVAPEPEDEPQALSNDLNRFDTAVDYDTLYKLNQDLLKRPDGFNGFRKTEKILNRRSDALDEGNKADWGTGEILAYATLLRDGVPIRLTGQDTERGTFAHRHSVLHDIETSEKYSPLHGLEDAEASFDIRNSPLSEAGVLGFEYGYSVQSKETLVIWEAQFGDFANAGQVIFDQFIASARAKWGEISNMVMLLPHGYEGQGPEHSSARLERFLQMAAENNWIVANVSSSAQLFHLLRRQADLGGSEEARPLVVMTPKSSMIRNPRMASEASEFTDEKFKLLRNQPNLKVSKKNATRLLIGSGKVMIDIEESLEDMDEKFDWLRVLRLEQIYPFPQKELEKELKQLPNLEEIVWVQEEPSNMGAWDFVDDYLRDLLKEGQQLHCIARPSRAAPAGGLPSVHNTAQNKIIDEALTK